MLGLTLILHLLILWRRQKVDAFPSAWGCVFWVVFCKRRWHYEQYSSECYVVVDLRKLGLQSLISICQANVLCLDPRMFGDTVGIDGHRYTILWYAKYSEGAFQNVGWNSGLTLIWALSWVVPKVDLRWRSVDERTTKSREGSAKAKIFVAQPDAEQPQLFQKWSISVQNKGKSPSKMKLPLVCVFVRYVNESIEF